MVDERSILNSHHRGKLLKASPTTRGGWAVGTVPIMYHPCSMEKLHPGGLSSKPVVVMDDSSQHISPDHDACPISFDSGDRCLLADPLMGSGTIVECHTFLQHVVEMSFIQDEDVI